MKQYYPKVSLFLTLFSLLFYLPRSGVAQCLCSDGTSPELVVHNRVLSTSMEETIFTFPQFDPAVGMLVCTNVHAAITSVVRIRMENDEIYPASYNISYRRTSTISGPGLSPTLVHNFTKNYGPYDLAATDGVYFSGPDYIITPRDTILKDRILTSTINGDITPFLGSGTVNYIYSLAGNSVISGGGNYLGGPLTTDRINFTLTYSYCPTGVLASGIRDFSVQNEQGKTALLKWTTLNEEKGNTYEIEIRKSNENFQSIGSLTAGTTTGSTSSKYQYQYQFDQNDVGQLYFRIKQKTIAGEAKYSTVKMLELGKSEEVKVFPNPVATRFSLQFGEMLKGTYVVQVTNQNGQVILYRKVKVHNTSKIDIDLASVPPAGVYYLKAKEITGTRTYSSRIIFKP